MTAEEKEREAGLITGDREADLGTGDREADLGTGDREAVDMCCRDLALRSFVPAKDTGTQDDTFM